jgi:hypothetical protein
MMPLPYRRPTISVLSPEFQYVPAARTDVQATWKRFGWVPPQPPQRPQPQ